MVRDYDDEALPSVYNVEEIPGMEVAGGSTMKVFRGLDLMLGFSSLDPDLDELSAYSHPWEQLTFVRQGTCEVLIGDETTTAEAGDVFAVPPGVDHAVRPTSEEKCELIDFWPLVEGYLDQTEYQDEFADEE
jgi:mannose-6-phosphate isomerase-like protein (cupin superfamily)